MNILTCHHHRDDIDDDDDDAQYRDEAIYTHNYHNSYDILEYMGKDLSE